jgi:hypothetical protein
MSAAKKTCPRGHSMDASWNICPYCPPDGASLPRPTVAPAMLKTVREVAPGVAERAPEPGPRKTERLSDRRAPVLGWLVDIDGAQRGQDFRISEPKVLIGAAPECQIRLDNGYASERHAHLKSEGGVFVLTDLASTNGTRVNGAAVDKVELADGDRIQIGSTTYVFKGLFLEGAQS